MISSKRINILRRIIPLRCFHTTKVRRIDPKTVEEIKIPVPWGHIAGKWWGCKETQPIIAVHGLLDNAATFDTLMPLLKVKSVLCIDLPGHGRSSHLPQGSIHYMDYLIVLRYLIKHHYKFEKVCILGHSFGSSLCYIYGGLYPHNIGKMVNIECSRFLTSRDKLGFLEDFRTSSIAFSEEPAEDFQIFSWKEIISEMLEVRKDSKMPINGRECEIIAERGTAKVGNDKFRFSDDKRLSYKSFSRFTFDEIIALAENIDFDVLNIDSRYGLQRHKEWSKNLEQLKRIPKFVSINVDGKHYVHLESPEIVAPILNEFFGN